MIRVPCHASPPPAPLDNSHLSSILAVAQTEWEVMGTLSTFTIFFTFPFEVVNFSPNYVLITNTDTQSLNVQGGIMTSPVLVPVCVRLLTCIFLFYLFSFQKQCVCCELQQPT